MLVQQVHQTIRQHQLLRQGDRVLVALSGGPDSTALLHALHALQSRLGISLEAATVDHQLRAEAAEECALAMQASASLEVPCTTLKVRVEEGASRQGRARQARYLVLQEHAIARNCKAIAVGHTRDDQAETVLLRLLRGAGLRGLVGILPMREDTVIRPLLHTSRADVEAYLAHLGVQQVARDPSNDDTHYTRVRVRKTILPMLQAEHPHVVSTLADLAEEASEALDYLAAEALRTGLAAREILPTEPTNSLHPSLRAEVLRQWGEHVSGGPLNRAQREALALCLTGKGEVLLPGGRVVHRREEGLVCLSPSRVAKSEERG